MSQWLLGFEDCDLNVWSTCADAGTYVITYCIVLYCTVFGGCAADRVDAPMTADCKRLRTDVLTVLAVHFSTVAGAKHRPFGIVLYCAVMSCTYLLCRPAPNFTVLCCPVLYLLTYRIRAALHVCPPTAMEVRNGRSHLECGGNV